MSIIFLIVVGVGVIFLLSPVWILNAITDRKWPGVVYLFLVALVAFAYVSIITGKVRESPAPTPIDDQIENDESTSVLRVERVRVDFTDDSRVEIELGVINSSTYEIRIETSYYANSGTIGAYSPGASGRDWVSSVTPEWKGSSIYKSSVPKFVPGGRISISLVNLYEIEELDLEEREEIFSKEYVVVPKD